MLLRLGYKDSNLEMTESESVALPFGDTPSGGFATHKTLLYTFQGKNQELIQKNIHFSFEMYYNLCCWKGKDIDFMVELGKWQTLKVVRSKEFGIYLA